jgi:hypothetical protein
MDPENFLSPKLNKADIAFVYKQKCDEAGI